MHHMKGARNITFFLAESIEYSLPHDGTKWSHIALDQIEKLASTPYREMCWYADVSVTMKLICVVVQR